MPLDQIPQTLAQMAEEKREKAEQVEAYNEFLQDLREKESAAIERIGMHWFNCFRNPKNKYCFEEHGPAHTSVAQFLKRLTEVEIIEAVDIAHNRKPVYGHKDGNTFKYFCGVCWNKIREREGS